MRNTSTSLSKHAWREELTHSPCKSSRDRIEISCFTRTSVSPRRISRTSRFSVLSLTGSVVQRYGYFISNGNVNIVLEYMDEGSLNTVRVPWDNDFVALLSRKSNSGPRAPVHCVAIGGGITRFEEPEDYSPRPSLWRCLTSRTSSRRTSCSTVVAM